MKHRFKILSLALACSYVTVAACGDDEEAKPSATEDAGNDATTDGTTNTDGQSTQDVVTTDVVVDVKADRPELTGQMCTVKTDCYQGLDAASLQGEVVCLDKVQGGHCTHECVDDNDCCAVPGECKTGLKQVCSTFESSGGKKYCFLSCESADIAAARDAGIDAGGSTNDYCTGQVSAEFGCRNSGGGVGNRKVCLPNPPNDGGTNDAGDAGADAADASDAADADG